MIIDNIRLHLKHKQPYDKETINEKLKAINDLFDEITIRPNNCIMRNDGEEYRVILNSNYIDFDIRKWENINLLNIVIDKLDLVQVFEDVKITILIKIDNEQNFNNFNNLLKNVPPGALIEFLGFRYVIEDINYFTSLFINLENNAICRIGFSLNNVLFQDLIRELEEQKWKIEAELMPLVNQFLGGC
jgi:hypothetical protein